MSLPVFIILPYFYFHFCEWFLTEFLDKGQLSYDSVSMQDMLIELIDWLPLWTQENKYLSIIVLDHQLFFCLLNRHSMWFYQYYFKINLSRLTSVTPCLSSLITNFPLKKSFQPTNSTLWYHLPNPQMPRGEGGRERFFNNLQWG